MMNFSLAILSSVDFPVSIANLTAFRIASFLGVFATRRAPIILTWSSINRRAPAGSRISISFRSSLCTSRMRCATAGVSVEFRAGHDTCCSEMSCTTSTRLREASATARWKSRPNCV